MVADALSRRGSNHLYSTRYITSKLTADMVRAGIELIVGKLANIALQSTLLEMICMAQDRDSKLVEQ